MSDTLKILMLGASYGSLLATKLLLAGHNVTLVCLPREAELINADGLRVRLPVKGCDGLVEVHSAVLPGTVAACAPDEVEPSQFDLAGLAMQEPQFQMYGVRQLLDRIAKQRLPCLSIMNMPPLPYLKRIPGLNADELLHCYTDASVWRNFDPDLLTLCSPDPQAFRPPEEPVNVLQVALPTNFKAARFASDENTSLLSQLETDILASRFPIGGEDCELPVKLRVHQSLFVPLAKWSMLLAGNYRCVQASGPRSIRDAVHSDLEHSGKVYEWVGELCRRLGAAPEDQVPFEKYAAAAKGLGNPSSAARALFAGATNIERVDRLVQSIARQLGVSSELIDESVALVDQRLEQNRRDSQ